MKIVLLVNQIIQPQYDGHVLSKQTCFHTQLAWCGHLYQSEHNIKCLLMFQLPGYTCEILFLAVKILGKPGPAAGRTARRDTAGKQPSEAAAAAAMQTIISKSCMHLNNRSFHILQRGERGRQGGSDREREKTRCRENEEVREGERHLSVTGS